MTWLRAPAAFCIAFRAASRGISLPSIFLASASSSPTVETLAVSEQTIKALAGHVSRQMLERYSHIRSQAKQAAIQTLDNQAIAPVLEEGRYNFRYSLGKTGSNDQANS